MHKKRKFIIIIAVLIMVTALRTAGLLSGVELVDLLKIVIPAFFVSNAAEIFNKNQ